MISTSCRHCGLLQPAPQELPAAKGARRSEDVRHEVLFVHERNKFFSSRNFDVRRRGGVLGKIFV